MSQIPPGTPLLDVSSRINHEDASQYLTLKFGAQQLTCDLTRAQAWELIRVLTGGAKDCVLPVSDFYCPPIRSPKSYLELTPELLNARKMPE